MKAAMTAKTPTDRPVHPLLDAALRHAVAAGTVIVLLVPSARGVHAAIGWLPLWLVAMPLLAWWALHGFALPRRDAPPVAAAPTVRPRRRSAEQARRRSRAGARPSGGTAGRALG